MIKSSPTPPARAVRRNRIFWRFFGAGFLLIALFIIAANLGVFGYMPSLAELENPAIVQASEVYSTDGTLMGKYYVERGNRTPVRYREISPAVIDALVATEDERFYEHNGIDFKSTLRALFSLGAEGGGSTITQQLAKALLAQGSKNKAWRVVEKMKEWIIAVRLERNFSKEEIMTLYLNAVPFGNNLYGIRNSSLTFFQKEPKGLQTEEAALLVGLLKGNTIYNPMRNYKNAIDRRNVVLKQMEVNGKITLEQKNALQEKPYDKNLYHKLDENTGPAPYFREILKEEIKERLKGVLRPDGEEYNIYKDGLKIYTTIDLRMQTYAEEGMASHMVRLQKSVNARRAIQNGSIWKGKEALLERAMRESDRWKNMEEDGLSEEDIKASFQQKVPMRVFSWNTKRETDTTLTPMDSIKYHKQMEQSGFLAMDPITGEIRAWVGGISFSKFKYDHVNLNTKRQVGSTIKPLLYTQAMEERGFQPESPVENTAQLFDGYGWVPAKKACGGGTISMADALAYSKNCATAFIMKQVGPESFTDFLSRLKIPTRVEPYPSICLGACDLSLFEMLWSYTIFAGRGFSTKPRSILRIEDRNGRVLKQIDYLAQREEVISEATAYTMTRMMQGAVDKGTAAGMRSRVGAMEMGGKTGTTNDNADAWFIGYTPQMLVGAWVGFDDRFIRNEGDGSRMARPICEYFLGKVLGDPKSGIEKGARFLQPEQMMLQLNSADIIISDTDPLPGATGENTGAGSPEDYEDPEFEKPDSPDPTDKQPAPPKNRDTLPRPLARLKEEK
ncbi:MAG: penicillin-binding protein [Bacteroidetes bacterium]|nr:penicillin-binding protein [Bacteroidota bacterium]